MPCRCDTLTQRHQGVHRASGPSSHSYGERTSGTRAHGPRFQSLSGSTTYLDAAIVSPFSSNPALIAAPSTRPGHMAKRAEKIKFDRYPHVNLVPFILETTGRPGHHDKKFISNFMKDADHPPLAMKRDTWSAIQTECPPQRYLQTTTLSSSHVTLDTCSSLAKAPCHVFMCCAPVYRVPGPSLREHPQLFYGTLPQAIAHPVHCRVLSCVPRGDAQPSARADGLLFADALIAPVLLTGLSDVDELMVALGCRFAVDIFTIAQQDRPHPEPDPLS